LNVGALGVKIELYSLKCDVLISEQLFGSLAKGAVALHFEMVEFLVRL